jgi:tetratricopeptide (TPR) repeat protein
MRISSDPNRLAGLVIRVVLGLAGLAGLVWTASGEAVGQESPQNVVVEVLDIDVDSRVSRVPDPIQSLRVELQVTNHSDRTVVLQSETLTLTSNENPCPFNPAVPEALLPGDVELAAGETVRGWVMFAAYQKLTEEPVLRLAWTVDGRALEWSLNDELRRLLELQTDLIGPDNCLAVISLNAVADQRIIWVLAREFRRLAQMNIQRVVVSSTGESSSPQRSQIITWLGSAVAGNENGRLPFNQRSTSPVQFAEFHVAGFGGSSSRSRNSRDSYMHADREHAVAAALGDIYKDLPLELAIRELNGTDAGIRRAALTSTVDRLHAAQLQQLIAAAKSSDSAEQQALVAEMLARVAYPNVVDDLRHFVLSSDQRVSQAALKSLVDCLSPETMQTMKDIWLISADNPSFRVSIVREILDARDYRWIPFLAEYAELQLEQVVANSAALAPQTADDEVITDDPDAEVPSEQDAEYPEDEQLNPSEVQTLKRVLAFLQEQQHPEFIQVARTQVLKISNRDIQDVVLGFILDSDQPEDNMLIRQYIEQRLPEGRMSSELINTIRQYPDTRYTESLLELSRNTTLRSHERRSVLTLAIRCASDSQMDLIINEFPGMDRYSRPLVLQQLAALNHPRWLELAKESINSQDTSLFNTAMAAMRSHASPEVLEVLLSRMEEILDQAENKENLDSSLARQVPQMVASVGSFTHPSARRILNRCYISPFEPLRDQSRSAMARIIARSPGYADFVNMEKASRDRKHEEAMKHAHAALLKDPFMADALHSRASLYLLKGEVVLAIEDLHQASKLNPEDTVADSTLAIATVRMGQVKQGLADAEEILRRVPEEVTNMYTITLYNAACAYARAVELPDVSEEDRRGYADRAMELMFKSAEGGFNDADHTAWDPDLQALHSHDRWDDLIARIDANEAVKP